jgi:hypothetical protein
MSQESGVRSQESGFGEGRWEPLNWTSLTPTMPTSTGIALESAGGKPLASGERARWPSALLEKEW